MSVSEKDSGIVDTHTAALERVAAAEDTFIFVRPTEYDTTVLIRAGYATKSMDVHHKSSNWGPMAGFVPCDPAFSKKCEGLPNPKEHEHKHGAAHPTQLTLTDALLSVHEKIKFQPDYQLAPNPAQGKLDLPWVARRGAPKGGMSGAKAKFETFQTGGTLPDAKFCLPEPSDFGNKATLFCLVRQGDTWSVFWVQWNGEVGTLNPLRVFAYPQKGKLVPVTGDYDLWMVAPHFKHFDAHALTRIQKDKHGSSAASGYTLGLIPKMNAMCNRTGNPVFNHGAEAQNYGFTQALDWNLAMFTPGGTSRMVRMNQMPDILADLQQAGYLVVWNKRYGENDPRLMNKSHERTDLAEIRKEMDELFKELDEIRRTANPTAVAKETLATKKMPSAMQLEIGKMAKRFETSRNLGLEHSRIYRFNRKLLDLLDAQSARLRALSVADFSKGYHMYEGEVRRLHADLQRAMVNATKGSGESDDVALKLWFDQHRTQIERLKTYWSQQR